MILLSIVACHVLNVYHSGRVLRNRLPHAMPLYTPSRFIGQHMTLKHSHQIHSSDADGLHLSADVPAGHCAGSGLSRLRLVVLLQQRSRALLA